MNVLMISPGYPPEMPFFTLGLARAGARVIGLGDQPEGGLAPMVRDSLLTASAASTALPDPLEIGIPGTPTVAEWLLRNFWFFAQSHRGPWC